MSRQVKQVMVTSAWMMIITDLTDIRQRLVRLAEASQLRRCCWREWNVRRRSHVGIGGRPQRQVLIVDTGAMAGMVEMARYLHLAHVVVEVPETSPVP
jgi:hypothetical protein